MSGRYSALVPHPSDRRGREETEHGGPLDRELSALGLEANDLLDFSVNVNPYGPCKAVVEAVHSAATDRYPDPTGHLARRLLAQLLEISPDGIALGNGAAELLWTLARALLVPGDTALVVEPTFSELRHAAVASGARIVEWRAAAAERFAVDLRAVGSLLREHSPRVAYLCSPNSPTGVALGVSEVAAWAAEHSEVVLILDQSFLSLSERYLEVDHPLPRNVVCVRSLTKDYGIPGVRIGYAVGDPALIAAIEGQRPPWTTSCFAQAAVRAACTDREFVTRSRRRLLADRRRLSRRLSALGLETFDSATSFLLVRIEGSAAELRRRLLRHHRILVRDCASYDLPDFIRIAARPDSDSRRLIDALRALLTGPPTG